MKRVLFTPVLIVVAFLLTFTSTVSAQQIASTGSGGLWSAASTWTRISGTGALPGTGDHVIISRGSPVTLDTNMGIQNLAHLDIQDVLTVQGGQGYKLGASRIDVGAAGTGIAGAAFLIGSAAAPFTDTFVITLTETFLSSAYTMPLGPNENKTFAVHAGATLELHGRQTQGGTPIASWAQLQNGNSLVGGVSNTLVLDTNPGWKTGDKIVIASTDFDMFQAEERTVQSVSGNNVVLSAAVQHNHHGVIELGLVDERAEIGLLSRNIVIQGDSLSAASMRGGHMMFMNANGTMPIPVIHIDGVEIKNMGWHGELGRYPIHFHRLGNAPGNYVRNSSLHHNYHRAVTIHQTNDIELTNNVAYDTWGHTFYLEDRVEVRNTFTRNLGLVTRLPIHPDSGATLGDPTIATGREFFTASDTQPSTYWITDTDNTLNDNVAAGSHSHGFWYDLDIGVKAVAPVRFTGNVAHSNGIHGFFQEGARMITVDNSLANPLDSASIFLDFTGYKNRRAAVWHRSYGLSRWVNTRVADNGFGFYLASEGFQQDYQIYTVSNNPPYNQPPFNQPPFNQAAFNFSATGAPGFSIQTVESSVVIGESGNTGNPTFADELNWPTGARSLPEPNNPQKMLKGVELYDGFIAVLDTHFHNFNDTPIPTTVTKAGGTFNYRASAALTSQSFHSVSVPGDPWGVDPRNAVLASTFTNVQHPVLFPMPHPGANAFFGAPYNLWVGVGPNGVASAMIFDIDGSIPGPGSGPNTYVTNNTPLLRPLGFPAPTPVPSATHYAEPLFVPGPGTAGNDAYGQLEILFDAYPATIPYIELDPVHRPGQAFRIYSPVFTTRYPMTVLLENPSNTASPGVERYNVNYPPPSAPMGQPSHNPMDDPRNVEIHIKFSEPGRGILLEIPYDGGGGAPTNVDLGNDMFPGALLPATQVFSINAVENGSGVEYFYDPAAKKIYLKPTLIPWTGTAALPILEGRELIYYIQG